MNDESRLLLRVDEVAKLLGLGRSKTYELMATGDLPSISLGRARRIPAARLQAWLERKLAENEADNVDR